MSLLRIAFALLLGAVSAHAVARQSIPIVDHEKVVFATGSGKPVTAEQAREAVIAAGRRFSWEIGTGANNNLTGTLRVRNKHTIVVNISVAADTYSVKYQSSINMNYAVVDGRPVIHPNYNKWVQTLVDGIGAELKKP